MGLCFGVVSAVLDARSSGRGRVVDTAIVDVVAMLGTIVQAVRANGQIDGTQPSPFYDSPFYDAYVCADGRFITIGALEPQFYALLLKKLQLDDVDPTAQSVARLEGMAFSAVRELSQRPLVSSA